MSFFSGSSDVEDNPPNSKIFSRYAQKLLEEVDLPINDANTLKATVYLCFSQIACIGKMTRGKIENSMMEGLIENMVKDAVTSIKGLGMITIGDNLGQLQCLRVRPVRWRCVCYGMRNADDDVQLWQVRDVALRY